MNHAEPLTSPFVWHHRVRWGECDPAGVVYTPRFSDYVVEAFIAYLEALGPGHESSETPDGGHTIPAKSIQLLFMQSLRPGKTSRSRCA